MSIKKSFSLIEVMIFVTILSFFLVMAASIMTVALRQNSLRVSMIKATRYNEQLMEWIRSEKESNWDAFATRRVAGATETYCFISDTFVWGGPVASGASCKVSPLLGGKYWRYATLKTIGVPPSQVDATVETDWKEGEGNNYSTKLHTIFTLWE